jgi:hypothetical protein
MPMNALKLAKAWKLSDETAEKILAVCKMNTKELDEFIEKEEMAIYTSSHRKEMILQVVNKLSESYGIEDIRDTRFDHRYFGNAVASYVNTGDSYTLTLVWDHTINSLDWTSYSEWIKDYESVAGRIND